MISPSSSPWLRAIVGDVSSNKTFSLQKRAERIVALELVVEEGVSAGTRRSLSEGPVVIGSDPGCDVVLSDDDAVSSRHCEVTLLDGRASVRDLNSTNGTFVDGVRIGLAYPRPGVKLKLGRTMLTIMVTRESEELRAQADRFGPLLGRSAAMRALFVQLFDVSDSAASILIEGETGTGKDLTAQAVHQAGRRAEQPLLVFDCGAVAESLIEGELFGYERGAFTGAAGTRVGLAEASSGGTLVLDEIGELPLSLQPKLLRLLESKTVRRLGSNQARPVDLRVIACTNRSLKAEVAAGRFREDLYFRLSTLRLRVPALRERPDDIPLLIDHLLERGGHSRRFESLAPEDQELLLNHRWPGNVRELRNTVERLVVFRNAPVKELLVDDADGTPASPVASSLTDLPLLEARRRQEEAVDRAYIREVMQATGGNVAEAARRAGVSRQFLHRLLTQYSLR